MYGIAWGTRGWVYISSHGVGYDIPSVVNDDNCGVHSRPYHSRVIACVMQVREEHAMGHDSGEEFSLCPGPECK